jgi:hypothetical protein
VGSCEEQIVEILWEQHQLAGRQTSTSELKQEALLRFMTSGKTVENTVARMVQARPQKVVRPRRGFYALAPAEIEKREAQVMKSGDQAQGASIGLSTLWGGKKSNQLQQRGSTNPPPTPHRGESGVSPPRLVTKSNPPHPPSGGRPGGSQTAAVASDLPQTPPAELVGTRESELPMSSCQPAVRRLEQDLSQGLPEAVIPDDDGGYAAAFGGL